MIQTLRTFVALYFVLFVGLLIPHHLADYWSCSTDALAYTQSGGETESHDATACQICFTHGNVSATVVLFDLHCRAELSGTASVVAENRLVAGAVLSASSRAPPLS